MGDRHVHYLHCDDVFTLYVHVKTYPTVHLKYGHYILIIHQSCFLKNIDVIKTCMYTYVQLRSFHKLTFGCKLSLKCYKTRP